MPVNSFARAERSLIRQALERGINSPLTTSAGRLFDGLAAIIGLHPRVNYEGQAAIAFEAIAEPAETGESEVPLRASESGGIELDWRTLVREAASDFARGVERGRIAARAHAGLARAIADTAARVGAPRVALSGGCFQNRLLTEGAARLLRESGHEVLLHRQVPPNDGGVSLGQAMVARARLNAPAP